MMIKSINAGEYTDTPAQGPMMQDIWGITPDAAVFLKNMPATPLEAKKPS